MEAAAWDLTQVFRDDEAALAMANLLPARATAIAESAAGLLERGAVGELASALGELEQDLDHVHDYTRMRQYGDAVGEGVQTLVATVDAVATEVSAAAELALDAWRALSDEDAERLLADPVVESAGYRFRRARELARHRLSPDAERAWAARSESAQNRWASLQEQVEGAARVAFDDGTGRRDWGLGDLWQVLRRPEADLRAAAYEAVGELAAKIEDVLAIAWDAAVADRQAEDRLRGRVHPAQQRLDEDDLSLDGLRTLVQVSSSGFPERQRMLRALRDALGLERLTVADADAGPSGLPTLTYDEVVELALDGIGSLAPELREEARRLVDGRRIDAETRPGKQSYAVTLTSRLVPPAFVAFRYSGQAANVPLLGHELGHAVALARAAAAQPSWGRSWPGVIFEAPSMTGEIAAGDTFVVRHPVHASGIRLVAAQDLAWSAFETVAFCRVELELYEARASGTVLDAELIRSAFERHLGELYGADVEFGPVDARIAMIAWANYAIPSRFYNFQYAVGAFVALALHAIRSDDPERFAALYLELLDRGRSASPAEQLAPFGLELGSPELWERGLAELRQRFDLL